MKKTDLYKNQALKLANELKHSGTSGRFGAAAGTIHDKREQRNLDRAQGLMPFAVKLNVDLINKVNELAKNRETSVNAVVAELLTKALSS